MSRTRDLSRRLTQIHQTLQPPIAYDCRGARDDLIAQLTRHMTPEQRARMNEPRKLGPDEKTRIAFGKQMLAEMGREREKEAAAYRMRRR